MDSEHRHELKANEFEDFIKNFPEFCKKNGSTIIGVILIIAAIVSYFGFKNKKQKDNLASQVATTSQISGVYQNKLASLSKPSGEESLAETGFAVLAENLKDSAEKAKSPHQAALMLIKSGEALRSELHYGSGDVDQAKINTNIEMAKATYEEALEKAEGNSTLTAMATYGLALCEEEAGNFEKASEILKGIASNEAYKGTTFPAQAQMRLEVMGDHEKTFKFVKAEIKAPKGFDEDAKEALKRGDIYIEPKKETPITKPEAKPEVKPEAKPTTKPEVKPEVKPGKDEVYDVGPNPK